MVLHYPKPVHSLFTYAGTKFRLLKFLFAHLDNKFNQQEQIWVEPFCGSCVVGFNFIPQAGAIFNDSNEDIIGFWKTLQEFGAEQIIPLFMNCVGCHSKQYYNDTRAFYNNEVKSKRLKAAMFLYLCKSSFSQTLRYNKDGKLNMAYSKFDYMKDEKHVESILESLWFLGEEVKKYTFTCSRWEECLQNLDRSKSYFIYCDPPYIDTYQDYKHKGFTQDSQFKLLDMLNNIPHCDYAISGCTTDKEEVIATYPDNDVVFQDFLYNMNAHGQRRVFEYLILKKS